jgi:hypothetical protein
LTHSNHQTATRSYQPVASACSRVDSSDTNLEGKVDGSDYTLIDSAFNRQGVQFNSQIADPDVSIPTQLDGNVSAVPEPSLIGALAIAPTLLLRRRGSKVAWASRRWCATY